MAEQTPGRRREVEEGTDVRATQPTGPAHERRHGKERARPAEEREKGVGHGKRESGAGRGAERGRTGPSGQKGKRECFLFFSFSFFQNDFKTFEFNFEFLVKTSHLNKSNAPASMHNNVATPYNEF